MFICTMVLFFGAADVGGFLQPRSVPCCGAQFVSDGGGGTKTQRTDEEYQRKLNAILKSLAEHRKSTARPLVETPLFKATVAEVRKMSKAEIERARREIREAKAPTNAKERERYLVRLAVLHLSPENARKVGFTPEETKLVAIPKKSEDVWDHLAYSACFISATLNGADTYNAACFCHCAYIAQQTLPMCAQMCNPKN